MQRGNHSLITIITIVNGSGHNYLSAIHLWCHFSTDQNKFDITSSNQGKILIYSEFFSKMMKYHQTVIKSRSELKVTGSLSKNSKVTSILDKIPKTKDAILINQNWLMGNP